MSDVAKFFSNMVGGFGDVAQKGWRFYGDASQFLTGSRGLASHTTDKVADFYGREVSDKSGLRGAELESFLSGLPIIGGVVRGIEGINQIEDLYSKTGKLPAYPGASGVGAGGIGSAVGQLSHKIENGSHDLAEFYSGDRDINNIFDSVNGQPYSKMIHPAVRKFGSD